MTQTVTNRPSSYFTSTLAINDDPDNIAGTYRVIVGGSFGETTSSTISMRGTAYPLTNSNIINDNIFIFLQA